MRAFTRSARSAASKRNLHCLLENFQRALNAILPPTIRIMEAEETAPTSMHVGQRAQKSIAIGSTAAKSSRRRMALRFALSVSARRRRNARAAAKFVGKHDFASFAASTGSEEDDKERSTEREIYSTELVRSADSEELIFTVRDVLFFAT